MGLPLGFTRSMVMDMLGGQGLAEHVDFLYVPVDLSGWDPIPYGIAFVNLVTPEAAKVCLERLNGYCGWDVSSVNICEAIWCSNQQGLQANIEKYRNSGIMHEAVDDEYKPAVFMNGFRMTFPPMTRTKAPK